MRVLTYNIWAPYTAAELEERINAMIPEFCKHDIVCVQELFHEYHYPLFEKNAELQAALPYQFRFQTTRIGNGLLLLSRFPFESTPIFHQYYLQGKPEKMLHHAFYIHKGVALTRVRVPLSAFEQVGAAGASKGRRKSTTTGGGEEEEIVVNVYNTHTIACYESYKQLQIYEKEQYAALRLSQVAQLSAFISSTSPSVDDHVIVCGDFNADPQSPELKLLRSHFQHSSNVVQNMLIAGGASAPAGGENQQQRRLLSVLGDADCPTYVAENPWNSANTAPFWEHPGKFLFDHLRGRSTEDLPVQLDHMLYSSHSSGGRRPKFFCTSSRVAFTERTFMSKRHQKLCPLSDHYGIEATFALAPTATGNSNHKKDHGAEIKNDQTSVDDIEFAGRVLQRSAVALRHEERMYFVKAIACLVLALAVALLLPSSLSLLLLVPAVGGEEGWHALGLSCWTPPQPTDGFHRGFWDSAWTLLAAAVSPIELDSIVKVVIIPLPAAILKACLTILLGFAAGLHYLNARFIRPDHAVTQHHQGNELVRLAHGTSWRTGTISGVGAGGGGHQRGESSGAAPSAAKKSKGARTSSARR